MSQISIIAEILAGKNGYLKSKACCSIVGNGLGNNVFAWVLLFLFFLHNIPKDKQMGFFSLGYDGLALRPFTSIS
jgi:hypothetical protein